VTRDERGAGTLLLAAVLLLAMTITAIGLMAAVFALAQRDAANGADLAALSGAAQYAKGQDACVTAQRIATQNGASLATCKVSGDSVDYVVAVTVERRLELPLGLSPLVRASAQAGRLGPVG
jgi:secretion/DNA translocation related TadE-like protein